MDKVIINGVDVSGCEYYDDGTCCNKDVMSLSCENTDCIYKQLKRLQAEYDDLHLSYAGCKTANTGLKELNQKLEQENERLKEENEKLNKMTGIFSARLCEKYRQALQEIRDIAKEYIVCDDCNFEGTDKCDARMCTHFYLNDFSQNILDKINEVIGAEE